MISDSDFMDNKIDSAEYKRDFWTLTPNNVNRWGLGFCFYYFLVHFHVWEWLALTITLLLTILWEIKNGIIPFVSEDYY